MGAKDFSLVGMILSSAVILGGAVYLLISGNMGVDSALGIAIAGISIGAPFAPVTLSIMLDKIGEIKNGKKS